MRRIALAALAAPAAVLLVAACGTSHPPASALSAASKSPSPSPSPTIDYGQQYLADVGPMNNADNAFGKAMTNRQNIRAYSRLSRTEEAAGTKMLRQAWPSKAQADIQAFAEALLVESGDDANVAEDFRIDPSAHSYANGKITYTVNASSMAADVGRETADTNKSVALAQKCRADLGLPPIG